MRFNSRFLHNSVQFRPTRPRRLLLLLAPLLLLSMTNPLPRVFLIGDSISIYYTPYLAKYLEGYYTFDRKTGIDESMRNLDIATGANGGDSKMVLDYLTTRITDPAFQPDILLINCGLHDIKRDMVNGTAQVDSVHYRSNLEEIFTLASRKKIKVIWISTTPVVDSIHNAKAKDYTRHEKDVEAYNAIAADISSRHHATVIDLFTFTKKLDTTARYYIDHVHFNDATRRLQAAFIAGYLIGKK